MAGSSGFKGGHPHTLKHIGNSVQHAAAREGEHSARARARAVELWKTLPPAEQAQAIAANPELAEWLKAVGVTLPS